MNSVMEQVVRESQWRGGTRRAVVIGHPFMGRGGSEAAVMWLIEALKQHCDLTVATTGGWQLEELNSFYGTNVGKDEVEIRIAPVPFLPPSVSGAAYRGACYQRFARKIAAEYDLRISAYNPTDWGLPAIHFIADFSWHQETRERLHPPAPGFVYRDSVLRKAYLKICAAVQNPSRRDVLREDLLRANSHWSANLIRDTFGVECTTVIYPPVWTEFPSVAWEYKEEAFVMIGRIAPEKQIERAIQILEAVREHGHAIRLHLCGAIHDDEYSRLIARLCKESWVWIVVEGEVSGTKKADLLANCRFGIQARGAEPFGISVAEMVKAGAIVFAPDNGGQAEILERSELLFADTGEASEKILALLEAPTLQTELRAHLAARAAHFNAENFMREARACVLDATFADQTAPTKAMSRRS